MVVGNSEGAHVDPLRKVAGELEPAFKRRALYFSGQVESLADYLDSNPTDAEFVAERLRHEMEQMRDLFGDKSRNVSVVRGVQVLGPDVNE